MISFEMKIESDLVVLCPPFEEYQVQKYEFPHWSSAKNILTKWTKITISKWWGWEQGPKRVRSIV
jgi:hypothetical protein